jgi:lysyl-tRNA synthetase class 2
MSSGWTPAPGPMWSGSPPLNKKMAANEARALARLKTNLRRRAQIIEGVRAFFRGRDYLEVETPVRVPAIAPEPNIVPFRSEDRFLATSPELHMKRLLAAGYPRLFQISRCFRRGERGRWHNPEFTMLEWYRAGAGYMDIIDEVEELIVSIAAGLSLGSRPVYQGNEIDITRPWPKTTVRDAFIKAAGWDPVVAPDPARFDKDLVDRVLPGMASDRPAVLMDYPAGMASLAGLKAADPSVAERAEAFIGGLELANAYSELTDPTEQAERFRQAMAEIKREGQPLTPVPERFLESLSNLLPCGGVALGIDRLVMLFCDAASIDEVMAFTEETA